MGDEALRAHLDDHGQNYTKFKVDTKIKKELVHRSGVDCREYKKRARWLVGGSTWAEKIQYTTLVSNYQIAFYTTRLVYRTMW